MPLQVSKIKELADVAGLLQLSPMRRASLFFKILVSLLQILIYQSNIYWSAPKVAPVMADTYSIPSHKHTHCHNNLDTPTYLLFQIQEFVQQVEQELDIQLRNSTVYQTAN